MRNNVLISNLVTEVKSNGSVTTNKPSTVSMFIEHRFAIDAQILFMDAKSKIERTEGLIGLELYAVYEDGKAKIDAEEIFEGTLKTLEDI